MDRTFWIDRWQNGDTGFHQAAPNGLLERHWPKIGIPKGAQVLVPLCGKSFDLVWLANQGYEVVGTELAAVAIEQFFVDRSRKPATVVQGNFTINRAGPFEIWCGDHFQMSPDVTRRIGGVFDRAALVAMPRVMQTDYATQLAALTPSGVPVLLVTLNYDPSEMDGPPFAIPEQRVEELFGHHFAITLLEKRDGLPASPNIRKRGVSRLDESAWKLVRR